MCGINGIVTLKTNHLQSLGDELVQMNNKIIHRGPDQDGFYCEENAIYTVGMSMRRLSIIDLNTGKQPIITSDNQKVIVYNGEIYNFKKLKEEHLSEYKFKTSSDTEVILALYEKLGVASFALLDGMFAFSIYDKTLNKIFIARDFFGEKPLYFTKWMDTFFWCSELKSALSILPQKPKISKQGLNLFFQLQYIPAPFSIYESVFKLEANHYLELDCKNLQYDIFPINQIPSNYKNKISKKEAIKLNHDLVFESVDSRSISDVPIGTFLSGGVDSSIISFCLAQQSNNKIDTFSIGFDKKSFDETDKSRVVAKILNSNHHEFILTEKDLGERINEILLNFDEPFADSSALPTYLVANKTKQYVKVALTGDGGDELYGGYNKYYMGRLNVNYTNIVPQGFHDFSKNVLNKILSTKGDKRNLLFKAKKFVNAIDYEGDFYFNIISLGFLEDERKSILKENTFMKNPLGYYKNIIGKNKINLTDFRNIDRMLSLEGDLLVKVDRAAMLTSLECRAPFLNKKMWDFTTSLPDSYLINGWDKKHLLKESFKKYFPEGFLDKSKQGFGVPVGDWLRGNLKEELLSYIDSDFIYKQDIFNYEEISTIVYNHIQGKIDNTFRVFAFFCFQKWYKNNF